MNHASFIGLGALAGLILATGMLAISSWVGARRITLIDRVAPYVRVTPTSSHLLDGTTTGGAVGALILPMLKDGAVVLEGLGSTTSSVRRRLNELSSQRSVEHFRLEQVAWGAIGLAGGILVASGLAMSRGWPLPVLLVICVGGGLAGVVSRDMRLTSDVTKRRNIIATELPDIAELLALAVGAGEGVTAALERVVRTARGAVREDLDTVLADVRSGTGLSRALENLSSRTGSPTLARFCDAVATALERGTPLADVLRAQAHDARDASRRDLMELAGRKEVLMMIPVVFLVLPITVLFALFPGLAAIQVGL